MWYIHGLLVLIKEGKSIKKPKKRKNENKNNKKS